MTKIDAITRGLSTAPYFALKPSVIAELRAQPKPDSKPEAETKTT